MANLTTVVNDENHQGSRRIFGVPKPQRGDEAVNKWYVDDQDADLIDNGSADIFLLMGG